MKVIAFTPLHYGAPYLEASIRSLIDHVDEYWILYTAKPSHNGRVATLPCPDSEDELYAIAKRAAGSKLQWIKGNWLYEHEQRDAIYVLVPDADVILSADSDEVWCGNLAQRARDYHDFAINDGRRICRVPFMHFWRCFQRGIMHDGQMPERICYPKSSGAFEARIGNKTQFQRNGNDLIAHFGYAVPPRYQAYKWSGIHGHQNELKATWLERVYMTNAQTDMHPVINNFWNAEDIDPTMILPSWMDMHPYAGMDVIE